MTWRQGQLYLDCNEISNGITVGIKSLINEEIINEISDEND